VFAAAIGIEAVPEADVRAVILAEDVDRVIDEKLRARERVFLGVPFGVRFEVI
jgi:hypothetical protein